ncbi:hypothetical protein [Treponema pedis]|uniref:PqqD family protein n=2 Tax=Treponema pedis TaxID=409322 RepID=S5ZMH5_9SPIR|nr:hypothetical protein [Treponema pedis]AGT43802.1 hypothetical protein TPE_1307 [Treponema pedis str. T A4]QOW61318.1 hypothetical protein IFE08_02680 [Treponema pedis]QSI04553.1 hypothetical protein DYQ05_06205 [Treponema pedis]
MNLKEYVLFRFEEKLNETCLIFDLKNYKCYTVGKDEYIILKGIQDNQPMKYLASMLKHSYENYTQSEIEHKIKTFIDELVNLDLIEV